jgi:hypothetical protein
MTAVKLSPAGIDLMSSFGPHFRSTRAVYAEATRAGRTIDWSRLRGEAVGVDRRDSLVAVSWAQLGGNPQLFWSGFIESELPL